MNAVDQVRLLQDAERHLRYARSAICQLNMNGDLLEPVNEAVRIVEEWREQQEAELPTDWQPVCFGDAPLPARAIDFADEVI